MLLLITQQADHDLELRENCSKKTEATYYAER